MALTLRRPAARLGGAIPRQVRVLAVTAVVVAIGVTAARPFLDRHDAALAPEIPWWALTLLFAAAEIFVLHVQVRREAQTISLSEIPLTLGLFFCAPAAFLVARVLGPAAVFVFHRRQAPIKVLYNVAIVFAEAAVALAVFHAITRGVVDPGPTAWLGAFAAAAIAGGLLSGVATATVISLYESRLVMRPFHHATVRAAPLAVLVSTLGLVGVHALESDPATVWLLGLAAAALFGAYRVYARLSERHLSLERLYEFSQTVTSTPDFREALQTLLRQSRVLLRSEEAELVLLADGERSIAFRLRLTVDDRFVRSSRDGEDLDWLLEKLVRDGRALLLSPRSRDADVALFLEQRGFREAVASPLRGDDGVVGAVIVANRLGDVRSFDADDAKLLETVANQASVALRKGQLIDQLRHEALHDALTGLPNRVALQRTMRSGLERVARGEDVGVAVMIMDLDRFKEVNDTLGHQQGDQLLREIAERLRDVADDRCVVGRLGGDEFGIVLVGEHALERALDVARAALGALERPFTIDGFEIEVGASLGLALAPTHGMTAVALLKGADVAMYRAKSTGEGLEVYDPGVDDVDPQRLAFVAELRTAIPAEELRLYVQPKVSLATGEVHGVEALVRWQHPTHGLVAPSEFIPVAERTGLIRPLTTWVVRAALDASARWSRDGRSVGTSVNLSPRTLTDRALAEEIVALVRDYDVAPDALTLEITESGVLTNPERALAVLDVLRDAGIRLSIDDFGTGYSSLSYLKRLPVDEVKIDRSFVATLADPDSLAIVRAVTDLGRALGLTVVAEGVEDAETLTTLGAVGCHTAQGYYLAQPMPVDQFDTWLDGFEHGRVRAPAAPRLRSVRIA